MGALSDELAELVRDRFKTLAELARVTNLDKQTVYTLFRNETFTTSRMETIAPIAEALELDPYWLTRGKVVSLSTRFKGFVNVPLFGSIAAGQPIEPTETDEFFPIHEELANRYENPFLLRVSGTSMNRILPDGCYALIEPCPTVDHPGQPYAVTVGTTDATVKRVFPLGNGLELAPDSTDPTWRNKIFDFADSKTEEVSIIGRVVSYYLPLNWRF